MRRDSPFLKHSRSIDEAERVWDLDAHDLLCDQQRGQHIVLYSSNTVSWLEVSNLGTDTTNNTRALKTMVTSNMVNKVYTDQDILDDDTNGVYLDLKLMVLERSGLRLADLVESVQASWGPDDKLHALTLGVLDKAIHHDERKVAADLDDIVLDSILEVGIESVLVMTGAELLECLADKRRYAIYTVDFASRELDQELESNDKSKIDNLRIA